MLAPVHQQQRASAASRRTEAVQGQGEVREGGASGPKCRARHVSIAAQPPAAYREGGNT